MTFLGTNQGGSVFRLVAGKIGGQAVVADRANQVADQLPHASARARGALRLMQSQAHLVGFRNAAGLRLLFDLCCERIGQPEGQSFNGTSVRQRRQSSKAIVLGSELLTSCGYKRLLLESS